MRAGECHGEERDRKRALMNSQIMMPLYSGALRGVKAIYRMISWTSTKR